jgi:hypothetical protein
MAAEVVDQFFAGNFQQLAIFSLWSLTVVQKVCNLCEFMKNAKRRQRSKQRKTDIWKKIFI